MKTTRAAIVAVLLASVAAIAMPLTANAFHGGGGHFGGFGGGGHFGGGGGGHFFNGGGHFHSIGGGRRVGGLSHRIGHGVNRIGHHTVTNVHHTATKNTTKNTVTKNTIANHHHGRWFATRTKGSFSHRAFLHDLHRHGYHRFAVFGWVGPLFWPYAFGDIYCDVFWDYWGYGCADPYWDVAYGDPFWDYGYDDIYGGLFSPFAYDDLTPYLPNGPENVSQAPARQAPPKDGTPAYAIAQMCGNDTKKVVGWPIDRIQKLVSPDDQQRKALDDLSDASVKAAQIIKSGCATSVAFTPSDRLAAMEKRLEAMQQAVETVRGPLDTFYGSLTDEQKAKFNAVSQSPPAKKGRRTVTAQRCTAATAATQWPEARIEAALHPNDEQQAKLKALQDAAAQAAQQLAASCQTEQPITPPARLAAVSKRLDVMLTAVKNVRSALDDLYSDLSDEQKAQFNRIGQANTAEKQG